MLTIFNQKVINHLAKFYPCRRFLVVIIMSMAFWDDTKIYTIISHFMQKLLK